MNPRRAPGVLILGLVLAACNGSLAATGSDGGTDDAGAGADVGIAPVDATSAPDAVATLDAPGPDGGSPGSDAAVDATQDDGPSGGDGAVEAGVDAALRSCNDECASANMQCTWTPYMPTPDGGTSGGVEGVSTCVVGDAGCAIWGPQAACAPSYGCCVGCHTGACPDGSASGCIVCPVGPPGSACTVDSDCSTNACDALSSTCVINPCGDHRQDGNESDVDCGGGTCLACASGRRCQFNSDCQSSSCANYTCF